MIICILSGQAYVALSRATTLDGLQVLNFSANKVCSLSQSTGKTAAQRWVPYRFKLIQKLLNGARRFLQFRIHSLAESMITNFEGFLIPQD